MFCGIVSLKISPTAPGSPRSARKINAKTNQSQLVNVLQLPEETSRKDQLQEPQPEWHALIQP